jgi:hypothetical protein
MAAGNAVVYAERGGKHQEKITLKLGNLLPN